MKLHVHGNILCLVGVGFTRSNCVNVNRHKQHFLNDFFFLFFLYACVSVCVLESLCLHGE